jgi:homoserine kinase type II
MAVPPASTAATLRSVLACFGVTADAVRDIRTGRVNRHWRIVAGEAQYALRRYNAPRSVAAIAFEHDLLRHVAAEGWPVAPPLPAASGETIVEAEGQRFALFPFLPGRPAPYNSARHVRLKGRLLARLHQDMASWSAPGQREGFGRLWELDVFVSTLSPFATLNELLRAFALEHPDAARAVRVQKYTCLRELARLGYGELPAVPIHADFHHDNVLFQRGELTGVLDFDMARLDARVADIAASIALDCLAPPAHNELDPRTVHAFVGGYVEQTPLTDVELRLIVPLVRAFLLCGVTYRLTGWANQTDPGAIKSVHRSVTHRFPSFERLRGDLETAVAQAAEERIQPAG